MSRRPLTLNSSFPSSKFPEREYLLLQVIFESVSWIISSRSRCLGPFGSFVFLCFTLVYFALLCYTCNLLYCTVFCTSFLYSAPQSQRYDCRVRCGWAGGRFWDNNSGWDSNVSPGQPPHNRPRTGTVELKYCFCSVNNKSSYLWCFRIYSGRVVGIWCRAEGDLANKFHFKHPPPPPSSWLSAHHFAILWASVGNTVPASFWAMYYLVSHPEALEVVRQEIYDVLNLSGVQFSSDEDVTLSREQLEKFLYLGTCAPTDIIR